MELNIYTDCSTLKCNKKLQWSILVVTPDEKEFRQSCKVLIDDYKKGFAPFTDKDVYTHSILSEMIAIRECIGISSKIKGVTKVNIYTDSLYSFNILHGLGKVNNVNKTKKHRIRSDFFKAVSKNTISKIKQSQFPIEIMWVRGHDKNWGNSIVDNMTRHKETVNELEKLYE